MVQNAYFLAKIGADTAENEQHLAEIGQKLATTRRGALRAEDGGLRGPRLRRVEAAGGAVDADPDLGSR